MQLAVRKELRAFSLSMAAAAGLQSAALRWLGAGLSGLIWGWGSLDTLLSMQVVWKRKIAVAELTCKIRNAHATARAAVHHVTTKLA